MHTGRYTIHCFKKYNFISGPIYRYYLTSLRRIKRESKVHHKIVTNLVSLSFDEGPAIALDLRIQKMKKEKRKTYEETKHKEEERRVLHGRQMTERKH